MNTEFDLLSETLPAAAPSMAITEPFRMRCPNCKKLYSVEAHHLGSEDLTRFECVSCQTAFFAMRPELNGAHVLETHELETQFAPLSTSLPTIDGFQEDVQPLERIVRSTIVEVPVATRECPNCQTLNALSNTECTKCEIIFEQFSPGLAQTIARDIEFTESLELTMAWQAVQDDYQNVAKHEQFVALCAADEALIFAAHKYAQILSVAPEETIARQMRSRVQGMVMYGFDAVENGTGWATWSFPLPSFNSMIIMLGTVLVCVGFGFPNMRHTAGLGFAMIALAIGLRVFLRRPRS